MSTTQTKVNTYLFFGGRCQEALDYYKATLGAEIGMVMRYNDSPDEVPEGMIAPGFEDKIMHSEFKIAGTSIYAADGSSADSVSKVVNFALTVPDKETAERYFNALAPEGTVLMPLGETFFSPYFGMVDDKFGIGWMVMVESPSP